jgi:hypothetical protein
MQKNTHYVQRYGHTDGRTFEIHVHRYYGTAYVVERGANGEVERNLSFPTRDIARAWTLAEAGGGEGDGGCAR